MSTRANASRARWSDTGGWAGHREARDNERHLAHDSAVTTGPATMTTQPDMQAHYLVSILDVLADEASSGAGPRRLQSLANSAAHLARQLADELNRSDRRHLSKPVPIAMGSNVIPFRRPL